ncbi:MAG: glycosyltransferase [Candidatus Omnitrophota bacterium]|nr:glycosyltransferase [Candidatus Omnitrophota bacterium]
MRDIREKVSVIIPAYDESYRIIQNLEETVKTFEDFGCPYEIIVVDDGSTDDTYEKVSNFSQKHKNVIILKNWKHYGKGRAIKKGCRLATGDYIVFLDADMDLHPVQLQTFMDIMRLDNADIVIGSKMHPNSILNYPLERKIYSRIYYFLVKMLFGLPIHDTQTGLKLFKREVIRGVLPRILVKEFAFDLEILANAHRLGYKIAEAPVVLNSKRDYPRVGLAAIRNIIVDTLAIFYRMYILKYYDRIDYHSRKGIKR